MKPWLEISIASVLTTASIWFFSDTILFNAMETERIEERAVAETMVTIGVSEPCKAEVSLAAFESLNQMGVYRWVVACEDSQ